MKFLFYLILSASAISSTYGDEPKTSSSTEDHTALKVAQGPSTKNSLTRSQGQALESNHDASQQPVQSLNTFEVMDPRYNPLRTSLQQIHDEIQTAGPQMEPKEQQKLADKINTLEADLLKQQDQLHAEIAKQGATPAFTKIDEIKAKIVGVTKRTRDKIKGSSPVMSRDYEDQIKQDANIAQSKIMDALYSRQSALQTIKGKVINEKYRFIEAVQDYTTNPKTGQLLYSPELKENLRPNPINTSKSNEDSTKSKNAESIGAELIEKITQPLNQAQHGMDAQNQCLMNRAKKRTRAGKPYRFMTNKETS